VSSRQAQTEQALPLGNVAHHPAAPATVQKSSEMAIFSFYIKHLSWFED